MSMCYGNNYQCDISCINSDLNMTSAMNETINGVWWPAGVADGRCQVTACELVEHVSGSGMNTTFSDLLSTWWFWPLFVVCVVLAAVVVLHLAFTGDDPVVR